MFYQKLTICVVAITKKPNICRKFLRRYIVFWSNDDVIDDFYPYSLKKLFKASLMASADYLMVVHRGKACDS